MSNKTNPPAGYKNYVTAASITTAVLALALNLVVNWEKAGPTWIRYSIVGILALLALVLWPYWVFLPMGRFVRKVWISRKQKKELARLMPQISFLLKDMEEKAMRSSYVYSLGAVIGRLQEDSANIDQLGWVSGCHDTLSEGFYYTRERFALLAVSPDVGNTERFLMEVQCILRRVESVAKVVQGFIPLKDDEFDDVHLEKGRNTELRKQWKQFCADYHGIVTQFESIDRSVSTVLPQRGHVRFDRL